MAAIFGSAFSPTPFQAKPSEHKPDTPDSLWHVEPAVGKCPVWGQTVWMPFWPELSDQRGSSPAIGGQPHATNRRPARARSTANRHQQPTGTSQVNRQPPHRNPATLGTRLRPVNPSPLSATPGPGRQFQRPPPRQTPRQQRRRRQLNQPPHPHALSSTTADPDDGAPHTTHTPQYPALFSLSPWPSLPAEQAKLCHQV